MHGRRPRTGDLADGGCCDWLLPLRFASAESLRKTAPTRDDASLTFQRSEMNAGAEAEFFAAPGFVHQRGRPLPARTRQQVVALLIEKRVQSRPNSLLIAAIPNFGDPAIDYAKYFHAANGGLGAVLELYRRLIDDRHVFPVVACDHEVQIEAKVHSDTSHMVDDALGRPLRGSTYSPRPLRGGCTESPISSSASAKSRLFHTTRLYNSTTSRAVRLVHENTSRAVDVVNLVATARSVEPSGTGHRTAPAS